MSEQNSSNKNNQKRNNNRKRHHNRNRKNNRNNNQQNASGGGGGNRKRNFNRNRRPKSLTPSRIIQKYDNLMDQYLVARKKFFEIFGRNSTKQ